MSAQRGGNASRLAKKPKIGKFMKLHIVVFFTYRCILPINGEALQLNGLIKLIISV
jgi:hypothetical protein